MNILELILKIKTHILGTSQESDKTIFIEENEAFYLDLKLSKDRVL